MKTVTSPPLPRGGLLFHPPEQKQLLQKKLFTRGPEAENIISIATAIRHTSKKDDFRDTIYLPDYKEENRVNIIRGIGILFIIVFVQSVAAYDIPEDKKYSPERDKKLLKIMRGAEDKTGEYFSISKLDFKKIRGYKVEGSLWSNEQWSYIIEIKNKTSKKVTCNFVFLNAYDSSGFLLDKYLLFTGTLSSLGEVAKKSDMFFIKFSDINDISSADITANCFFR